MGIEELEKELKELKAYAYDLNSEYAKFTQRIDAIADEIKNIKENGKEVEESNEVAVENEDVAIPQAEETSDVVVQIPEVEKQEEAVEIEENNNSVSQDVDNTNEELNNINLPTTDPIENNETQEVGQAQNETQIQDPSKEIISTPLIPTVEIPQAEVGTQEEVNNENNIIITKVDNGAPKAIVTTAIQTEKLKKSEEQNSKLVLGSNEQQTVKSPEEEMKEMMDQAQQLYAAGKTLEAQQLTEKVFNKTTAN